MELSASATRIEQSGDASLGPRAAVPTSMSATTPQRFLVGIALVVQACATNNPSFDRGWPDPPSVLLSGHAPVAASGRTRNVVIVTIDGVRWQEVFGGIDTRLARRGGMSEGDIVRGNDLTPNLHRYLAGRGVVLGAPGYGEMVASGPEFLSLPGYEEIFSGRASS
jgi:hypothetical protein